VVTAGLTGTRGVYSITRMDRVIWPSPGRGAGTFALGGGRRGNPARMLHTGVIPLSWKLATPGNDSHRELAIAGRTWAGTGPPHTPTSEGHATIGRGMPCGSEEVLHGCEAKVDDRGAASGKIRGGRHGDWGPPYTPVKERDFTSSEPFPVSIYLLTSVPPTV
jgi:hypothetical protein